MKRKTPKPTRANGRGPKPAPPSKKPSARLTAVLKLYTRPELAKVLGVSKQTVHQWHDVPARHALAIEQATGGKLKKEYLAPRFYPRTAA